MIILSRRVPSRFCCSINSSTCLRKSSPSSTSASAIRSPKVLIGGIAQDLAESFSEHLGYFGWRGKIPEQPLLGGFFQFHDGLAVEGVGGGYQDRFAQPVKGHHAPTLTALYGKGPSQLHVQVIFVQGQKSQTRFIGKKL